MILDTKELLSKISEATDIRRFIDEYEEEFLHISPLDYLNEMLRQKDMSVSSVARQSGQGEYVYKVFRGERKPSRDVILAIAVGMQMNTAETQLLLRISKHAALDPRDKRDSILLYSLKEGLDVNRLNSLLYDMQEPTL